MASRSTRSMITTSTAKNNSRVVAAMISMVMVVVMSRPLLDSFASHRMPFCYSSKGMASLGARKTTRTDPPQKIISRAPRLSGPQNQDVRLLCLHELRSELLT